MKLAIVGSRNWKDRQIIYSKIAELTPTEVVSGGALGVDTIAVMAADFYDIGTRTFKPDWNKYGKRAGAIRNKQIVDYCDKLIAFWDGKSKGTKISIDMAKKAGKLLNIYYENL